MNMNRNRNLCIQLKKNFSTKPLISNINPHFKSEAHAQSATTKIRLAVSYNILLVVVFQILFSYFLIYIYF
jgi:hypothetical protein